MSLLAFYYDYISYFKTRNFVKKLRKISNLILWKLNIVKNRNFFLRVDRKTTHPHGWSAIHDVTFFFHYSFQRLNWVELLALHHHCNTGMQHNHLRHYKSKCMEERNVQAYFRWLLIKFKSGGWLQHFNFLLLDLI